MSRLFVNEIKENEPVRETYRILEKVLRTNKQNALYLQFTLNDRTGSVSARLWNVTEQFANEFSDGDFVLCEGRAQRFQGNLQIIANKITKVDPNAVSVEDFTTVSDIDVPALIKRMRDLLQTVSAPELKNLVNAFLTDEVFMERFSRAYAGVRLHHAYPGGLLVHTVSMMELAVTVGSLYGRIVKPDLLLVGAFLHDVGKIYELSEDPVLPVYTDSGQALGHLYLGAELLARKIAEVESTTETTFDPKLATTLKHLVLSHHGSPEFGSVKPPMTCEALALHFIDALDAKLNEFHKYIVEDANVGKTWTNYIPAIERKLMR